MSPRKRYRSGILATCCIPWDEEFALAEPVFRRSIRHLIAEGIRDLYIFGTAGEGHAVTDSQFEQITGVFLEETSLDGVQGMVGVISNSLPTVIERIERAKAMGARCFQLSLPSWGVVRDREMDVFFQETCGRFPDCEFLHYNLRRTGRIITGGEYDRLAKIHPNLVATKNSTDDEERLRSLFSEAPQLQHFITEAGFAKAARLGECGFLVSIASINLARAREYFRAGLERDFDAVEKLQRELDEISRDLRAAVPESTHMDGAFDKMFCRLHDPEFPLRLLPPYESTSEEALEDFAARVKKRHPAWLPSVGT